MVDLKISNIEYLKFFLMYSKVGSVASDQKMDFFNQSQDNPKS